MTIQSVACPSFGRDIETVHDPRVEKRFHKGLFPKDIIVWPGRLERRHRVRGYRAAVQITGQIRGFVGRYVFRSWERKRCRRAGRSRNSRELDDEIGRAHV